jgi:hypothetical protein
MISRFSGNPLLPYSSDNVYGYLFLNQLNEWYNNNNWNSLCLIDMQYLFRISFRSIRIASL